MRSTIFAEYAEYIEKAVKENKDLDFLKNLQPNFENFKHSGYSCRKQKEAGKQQESNSIAKPPRKRGFGNAQVEATDKNKISFVGLQQTINDWDKPYTDIRKIDPKQVTDYYIKKVCRDYQSLMTLEETNLHNKDGPNTHTRLESERPLSPGVSVRKENFLDNSNNDVGSTRSKPALPGTKTTASPPQTRGSTAKGKAIRISSSQQRLKPKESEPTLQSKAASYARLQSARRGPAPFEFALPDENAVEIRCMLHPTIQRAWKYETDTWFPGMRQYFKTLLPADKKVDERKVAPKQFFRSKLFQYNIEDVEEARSKPVVRCSSNYIEPDRVERQNQLEKDKLIIAKRTIYDKVTKKDKTVNVPFKTLFPKEEVKTASIQHGEAYRPVSSHQFRENHKNNWVTPADFKLF